METLNVCPSTLAEGFNTYQIPILSVVKTLKSSDVA